jgi:serine/threonine protein kinase
MPDSGGENTTSASALTDLTLAVRMDGVPEQEVFVQHGLSIGRNPSNTICVDEPNVERIHAMVNRQSDGTMLLECVGDHLRLSLADDTQLHAIPLKPGATFKIGRATIRGLRRQTRPTVLVSDNPWQVRCPRCHETIVQLSHDATQCPDCKLEIQYLQSHAATGPGGGFEGWIPRHVGPYAIRAFVAQGGMGIILRGLHTANDLPAAVKLLKIIDDADPTWRARFLAEIETLKGLRHPNVVRLQDNGKDDKLLWLAMDWIDGKPLSSMQAELRESRSLMPIEQIREILSQVVSGLTYLHAKGIIHRDLKPSNVLMAQDGLVKMVDFGIARAASGQTAVMTQLTRTGVIAGTESYMSPEQAEGQALSAASDIYSLGVMWYELVVGRRPVGAFAAPNLVRSECPGAWSAIIARCLAVDPLGRPPLADIAQVLSSLAAQPPPIPQQRSVAGPASGSVFAPPLPPGAHSQPFQPPIAPAQVPFQPHPQPPPAPWRQPGPSQPSAGAQAIEAGSKALKSAGEFIQTQTPVVIAKLGPVGAWIKSHRGPSIGIGAAVFLVLVIITIRSCSSDPTPTAAGGGGGGNANKPNTPIVVPQKTPEQLYTEGWELVQSANSPYEERFKNGMELLKQSADQGNIPAMKALANIHSDARVGPNYYNPQLSLSYLRKAADKGDPQSIATLRQMGMWR